MNRNSITFTSDGNPNTRPSTLDPELQLINHDKYAKLAKIAMDFQRFQQPFNLVEMAEVQDFLQRILAERGSGSVDALYRKSCKFTFFPKCKAMKTATDSILCLCSAVRTKAGVGKVELYLGKARMAWRKDMRDAAIQSGAVT